VDIRAHEDEQTERQASCGRQTPQKPMSATAPALVNGCDRQRGGGDDGFREQSGRKRRCMRAGRLSGGEDALWHGGRRCGAVVGVVRRRDAVLVDSGDVGIVEPARVGRRGASARTLRLALPNH